MIDPFGLCAEPGNKKKKNPGGFFGKSWGKIKSGAKAVKRFFSSEEVSYNSHTSFAISDDNMKLNIQYGYDNTWSKEELNCYYIKKMFVDFYGALFEDNNKCFNNIEKNSIFNEWNMKLNELKLNNCI